MELKIKVCGMRDAANISATGELEPDYMGFIFYSQSSRFAAELSNEVLADLPLSVKKTGVFVNAPLEEIEGLVNRYDLDVVQLHGDEPADFCLSVRRLGVDVIKAFGIDEAFDFKQLAPFAKVVDFFLFDTKTPGHGGSGETFNWKKLKQYPYKLRYFLSGGIGPENIDAVLEIKDPRLFGVDLNSRFELAPGLKNVDELRKVFSKISTAVS